MTDFPRGWTFASNFTGGTPIITLGAILAITHVLDSFYTSIVTTGTAALPIIQVFIAASPINFDQLAPLATGKDSSSFSGLDLAPAPGQPLTIQWDRALPTGANGYIVIQGHDI